MNVDGAASITPSEKMMSKVIAPLLRSSSRVLATVAEIGRPEIPISSLSPTLRRSDRAKSLSSETSGDPL